MRLTPLSRIFFAIAPEALIGRIDIFSGLCAISVRRELLPPLDDTLRCGTAACRTGKNCRRHLSGKLPYSPEGASQGRECKTTILPQASDCKSFARRGVTAGAPRARACVRAQATSSIYLACSSGGPLRSASGSSGYPGCCTSPCSAR